MKNILLFFFILFSTTSYSQTIRANVLTAFPFQISDDSLIIDSSKNILKSKNPFVIIKDDKMEIIDGDTTVIYFYAAPELDDNEETFDRIWEDAEDQNGNTCMVLLFYYKKEKAFQLRVFYYDTESGYEMFLYPL
jgi:hypothetical protein